MTTPTNDLLTPFEKGNGNQTCTYQQCIDWYHKLDNAFDIVQLQAHGTTSIGKPLHLLVIDKGHQGCGYSAGDRE